MIVDLKQGLYKKLEMNIKFGFVWSSFADFLYLCKIDTKSFNGNEQSHTGKYQFLDFTDKCRL